jgi:DNA polymerase-3 subunit delta
VDLAGFVKGADAGRAAPVTLLHGSEPFLLDDAVARLGRAMFPGQTDLSLVREILDARAVGADGIAQSALMLPWLGDRRLVVARGVDGLAARAAESLAAYVKDPNPSTVLVLVAETLLEPSHWLLRAVPAAAVVMAPAPTGRSLAGWLRGHAQARGYALDEDAAAMLVELSGDDLTQLVGDVEKAALAGGPDNRRVTAAEIRAVVGEHRLRHVFDLTRALVARDTGSALVLLESLLNGGEEPLAVLGMLTREARAIWQVAGALRAGRAPDEIARGLRRPPAAATALLERARTLSPGTAARQLARCWEVERRLKLGGAARPELSLLVAELCGA